MNNGIEKTNETSLMINVPELKLVEPSKAAMIQSVFSPMYKMLYEFEAEYNKIITEKDADGFTPGLIAKAKRLRLSISKVRVASEKLKDKQKANILLEGKAITGINNVLKFAVTEKENALKEIENHFDILEAKRIEELQAMRVELLSKYVDDADTRRLASLKDDEFEALLQMKKQQHDDRIEAEKRAAEAEAKRIADEKAEQERIRIENAKLKAEREEIEKQQRIEEQKRAAVEAERKKLEAIENEKRLAEERKVKAKYEAKLKAEREEKQRADIEAKKKEDALREQLRKVEEEKAADEKRKLEAIEEEERQQQLLLARSDSDKFNDFILELKTVCENYSFKFNEYEEKRKKIELHLDKLIGM